jgi:hypothetical protein
LKRELRKKHVQRGFHHCLLGVDVENNSDTGEFICAGAFGEYKKRTSVWAAGKSRVVYKNEPVEQYFESLTEFENFLLSLKANSTILVFFNLSYDKYYLNNIIADLKINKDGSFNLPVLHNGNRIISVTLKNGVRCLDLANHVDGSLENWINYLKMPEKLGVRKVSLDNLFNRVMNDCKATFYLGKFIQDFYYNECKIPLQLTVGASALRIFQQHFFEDYFFRTNDFLSIFERQSYYGGRTELFRKGKYKTYNYDINSMYLSIMRDCLIPDVSSAKYIENGKNYRKHYENYLGIFHCTVKAPDKLYIPLLPVRLDKKLKFPLGTFTGTWTSAELKKAEALGYKILKVYSYIYYKQSKYYFQEFAKFVWEKRKEYKKAGNKGMDLMIKKIGNSLYGKFAQRNSNDYFGRIADVDSLPDKCEIFDFKGEIWVRIKGDLIPATFEFPAISSFITSYARLKLYEGIEANSDTMLYCDTDSLKLTAEAKGITIGSELGEFGFEGIHEYEFFRPKFYDEMQANADFKDTRDKGELSTSSGQKSASGVKCKGVPKRAEILERTKEYIKFRYVKPLREREAVRRHTVPNKWVEVIKIGTFADDKRVWNGKESEPVFISENSTEVPSKIK